MLVGMPAPFTLTTVVAVDPLLAVTSPDRAGKLLDGNSPVTPVLNGKPVALVSVSTVGVPRLGVVNTGDVASTAFPLPVVAAVAATPNATPFVFVHVIVPLDANAQSPPTATDVGTVDVPTKICPLPTATPPNTDPPAFVCMEYVEPPGVPPPPLELRFTQAYDPLESSSHICGTSEVDVPLP
jgi:hypothetical protein